MPKWLSIIIILTGFSSLTACSSYAHIYDGDSYESGCQRTTPLHTPPGASLVTKKAAGGDTTAQPSLDSYVDPRD